MSYESKLYIVEKTPLISEHGKHYSRIIAMFDMHCMGEITNVFKTETDCYFYADDGDTEVMQDCYGEPLKEASVNDVINALENSIKNGETYRRLFPVLAALKVIEEQQSNGTWADIRVLHYGY